MEEVASKIVETAEMLESGSCKEKEHGYKNILFLIISGLLTLLSVSFFALTPKAVKTMVDTSIEDHISDIKKSQYEMRLDIEDIKETQFEGIVGAGMAAYEKFKGLSGEDLESKLKSSTQNADAARRALLNQSARNILVLSDRELTLELEKYFGIN